MRITTQSDPESHLTITTRCKSVDDFITMFRRYVDGNSIFVTSLGTHALGTESAFTITLYDGAPVVRGRCVVETTWKTASNPFRLPGVLLRLTSLSRRSQRVFDCLLGTGDMQAVLSEAPPPPRGPRSRGVTVPLPLAAAAPVPATPTARRAKTSTQPDTEPHLMQFSGPEPTLIGLPLSPRLPDRSVVARSEASVITIPPLPERAPAPPPPGESPPVVIPRRRQTVSIPPLAPQLPADTTTQPLRGLGENRTPRQSGNVIPRHLTTRVMGVRATEPAAAGDQPAPASTVITRRYDTVQPPLGDDEVAVVEARGESFSKPTRVATPLPWVTAVSPCEWSAEAVLPANPLTTLTDADLAGLVECSLYETSGTAPRDVGHRRRRMRWWAAAAVGTMLLAGITMRVRAEASSVLVGAITHTAQPVINATRFVVTTTTVRINGVSYAVELVLKPTVSDLAQQ